MAKSAKELMEELARNKKFQNEKSLREKAQTELENRIKADEQILIVDLSNVGININTVWDFVNSENNSYCYDALPVLVTHLRQQHHPKVIAGIARSLAVKELSDDECLWNTLCQMYSEIQSDENIKEPSERGAQEAIAVALEALSTKERVVDLKQLIEKTPNGDGSHWLRERINYFNR